MSNAEIVSYLDMLSEKIASMYNLSEEHSSDIVQRSPMKKLLQDDAEYVRHMPLKGWAKLVYENFAT